MWIVFAVGASMLWGLTYVLGQEIYKKISLSTTLAFMCAGTAVVMFLISLFRHELKRDWDTLISDGNSAALLLSVTTVFILAELCIGYSIIGKNATLAGLVEISYPIFIAFFAYLFFRENTLNPSALAGGLLIFSGIFVIYHFNK